MAATLGPPSTWIRGVGGHYLSLSLLLGEAMLKISFFFPLGSLAAVTDV